jgi:tRNA(Ile)-lysidine synthase
VRLDPGRVEGVLNARLLIDTPAPIVVGFSGGGDSLALLLLAKAWADRHRRRLLALTVDHRLRPEGADWALWCRRRAEGLGVEHRTLVWETEKPSSGLSAAARHARHALLADAAREAGAGVILMGHTADDCEEAASMRAAGSSVPSPRQWSPSPAWPQGRGVFVLRPLLDIGRSELRADLVRLGETWIEDPANADPSSARARARQALNRGSGTHSIVAALAPAPADMADVFEGPAADLRLPAGWPVSAADLGAALLSVGGGGRPPRPEALNRLLRRIGLGEPFVATLTGSRLAFDGTNAHIVRATADHRHHVGGDLHLALNKTMVWDGRFEVQAMVSGARVGHLAGRASRLAPSDRRDLLAMPAAARLALPAVIRADGRIECPTLRQSPDFSVRTLAWSRLAAARGAIVNEAALWRMAKPDRPS